MEFINNIPNESKDVFILKDNDIVIIIIDNLIYQCKNTKNNLKILELKLRNMKNIVKFETNMEFYHIDFTEKLKTLIIPFHRKVEYTLIYEENIVNMYKNGGFLGLLCDDEELQSKILKEEKILYNLINNIYYIVDIESCIKLNGGYSMNISGKTKHGNMFDDICAKTLNPRKS